MKRETSNTEQPCTLHSVRRSFISSFKDKNGTPIKEGDIIKEVLITHDNIIRYLPKSEIFSKALEMNYLNYKRIECLLLILNDLFQNLLAFLLRHTTTVFLSKLF